MVYISIASTATFSRTIYYTNGIIMKVVYVNVKFKTFSFQSGMEIYFLQSGASGPLAFAIQGPSSESMDR